MTNDLVGNLKIFEALFDEVVIFLHTMQEHTVYIWQVVLVVGKHCLKVRNSKCAFAKQRITLYERFVDKGRIQIDSSQIQVNRSPPHRTNQTDLPSFLGIAGTTKDSFRTLRYFRLICMLQRH